MTVQRVPFYHDSTSTFSVSMLTEVDARGDYLLTPEQLAELQSLHDWAAHTSTAVSRLRRNKRLFKTVRAWTFGGHTIEAQSSSAAPPPNEAFGC